MKRYRQVGGDWGDIGEFGKIEESNGGADVWWHLSIRDINYELERKKEIETGGGY